jgi:hypothetical protein
MERTGFPSSTPSPNPSEKQLETACVLQSFDVKSQKLVTLFRSAIDSDECKTEVKRIIHQLTKDTECLKQKLDVNDLGLSREIGKTLEKALQRVSQSHSLLAEAKTPEVAATVVDFYETLLRAYRAAYQTLLATQLP